MNWTVELAVSYTPCPPEQAPAWRAAMETIRGLTAMNTNPDRRGRTADGRATYRPLVEYTEDDYPPESKYWHGCAMQAARQLSGLMGYDAYCEWLDQQEEPAHWRGLFDLIQAKQAELSLSQNSTTEGATA